MKIKYQEAGSEVDTVDLTEGADYSYRQFGLNPNVDFVNRDSTGNPIPAVPTLPWLPLGGNFYKLVGTPEGVTKAEIISDLDAAATSISLSPAQWAGTDLAVVPTLHFNENTMYLVPGVHALLAPPKTGKTRLTGAMVSAARDRGALLRVGEREPGSMPAKPAVVASSIGSILGHSQVKLLVVDSLRAMLFGGSGAATKTGLNPNLFFDLAAWNPLLTAIGVSVIVVITPLYGPEVEEHHQSILRDGLRGSCQSVIEIEGTQLKYNPRDNWVPTISADALQQVSYKVDIVDQEGGELKSWSMPWGVETKTDQELEQEERDHIAEMKTFNNKGGVQTRDAPPPTLKLGG